VVEVAKTTMVVVVVRAVALVVRLVTLATVVRAPPVKVIQVLPNRPAAATAVVVELPQRALEVLVEMELM
jgi:hypothetical protein